MPNASPADVRAGWNIFRKDPELSLEEINARLQAQGRKPIANRSLQHYRSLLRNGFDRYVPINRFDVARAAKPFEGLSALPRYFYYGVTVSVWFRYTRDGKQHEVAATAERVGEVGAVLVLDGTSDIDTLRRSHPSLDSRVSLRFDAPVSEMATARLLRWNLMKTPL